MKKLHKVITSLALGGVILTTTTCSFANTKVAYPADFGFKLNGRDVKLQNAEVFAIDGKTYLPLAALCRQLLGMTVDWNNETRTVEMWNITKPTDRGSQN